LKWWALEYFARVAANPIESRFIMRCPIYRGSFPWLELRLNGTKAGRDERAWAR